MRGAVILASATPKSRLSDQDALDLRIPLPVDLLEEVDILQCPMATNGCLNGLAYHAQPPQHREPEEPSSRS